MREVSARLTGMAENLTDILRRSTSNTIKAKNQHKAIKYKYEENIPRIVNAVQMMKLT